MKLSIYFLAYCSQLSTPHIDVQTLFSTNRLHTRLQVNMAALIDRDTNAQPTSNPTKDPEKPAIGEENKPQDGRQQYNYQVLEKAVAESNG